MNFKLINLIELTYNEILCWWSRFLIQPVSLLTLSLASIFNTGNIPPSDHHPYAKFVLKNVDTVVVIFTLLIICICILYFCICLLDVNTIVIKAIVKILNYNTFSIKLYFHVIIFSYRETQSQTTDRVAIAVLI